MKHLKKINELFDSEELKSSHEIEYLYGELLQNMKPIDIKNDSIPKLLTKISRFNVPFISAFIDYVEQGISLDSIDTEIAFSEDEEFKGYFFLKSERGSDVVSFGIKIGQNGYDAILFWDKNDQVDALEYKDLSYIQLIRIIKNEYTFKLKEFKFDELLNYGSVEDMN